MNKHEVCEGWTDTDNETEENTSDSDSVDGLIA